MKKFRVYVSQSQATSVVVEAETKEEAEDLVDDPDFVKFEEGDYVCDSYTVHRDGETEEER